MVHKAKKSLGQHFLRSSSAIKAIVGSADITSGETILEIGPGEGVLTKALLETGAKVIAVEKDRDLIPILNEKFNLYINSGSLQIIEGDVLEFVPEFHKLSAGSYKLVANIPYYITGAIFEKFLTSNAYPACLVVLIQKEVATRIVARDKKESLLSISVKAFGEPKITAKVPRKAFRPVPNVDSAVLAVYNVSHSLFKKDNDAEKHFFSIVKAGFAHKRKLLARNLETVSTKQKIENAFSQLSINPKSRPEDIDVKLWIEIANRL